jgi:hypothetical protein
MNNQTYISLLLISGMKQNYKIIISYLKYKNFIDSIFSI